MAAIIDEKKVRAVFDHFDQDKSGTVDTKELGLVLERLHIKLDRENLNAIVRRYDDDGSGQLDFEEFNEMLQSILKVKKHFEAADDDHSGSISAQEMVGFLKAGKGGMSPLSEITVLPLVKLFDEDGSGTVDFQEFCALAFYFQELEYQYENFCTAKIVDYTWLGPLMGPDNLQKVAPLAQTLQKLKTRIPPPGYEEFVRVIVKEAVEGNCDPTGRKKRNNAPRIMAVRDKNRVKPPKRGLKLGGGAAKIGGSAADRLPNQVAALTLNSGAYVDSAFAPSPNVLPANSKTRVFDWLRPKQITPAAKLFVDGVDEGDVIQGGLGDCWFLGALAVVATSTDNFIEHLFTQMKPEIGYYQCRFFKNGSWHFVDVDDRLPCSHSGKLWFASCKDTSEFWVPIVEKAYAKLHGSYEAIEMGNIADGLKDLTGEAVDVMLLDDASFKLKPHEVWSTLLLYLKESYLMGCALENSSAAAETKLKNGLLINHAYSIIGCEEVNGVKLMRIRNPWGKGEWIGPWGDGSKEWTPALLKHFNYSFADDGTFFMKFEDFLQNYNRIYVLRLMTDSEGDMWYKSSFLGEWRGESAGGCTNHPTWCNNPQYSIIVKQPNTKVFINLAQMDLRFSLRSNPVQHRKKYEPIGIVIMKTADAQYKKVSFTADERIATSMFCGMRDMSIEINAQPGQYVIIPCTFAPNLDIKFDIGIYTSVPATVAEITKSMPKKGVSGAWLGASAGGCVNNRDTWMRNPQFLLVCTNSGNVQVTLDQELPGGIPPECVGIYVFRAPTPQRLSSPTQLTVVPKSFLNVASVSEQFRAEGRVNYIVMPACFDAGVSRRFNISAASADTGISLTQL